MTTKGQVTVPVSVRNGLGLRPGSKVQFIELPGGHYEFRSATLRVESLKGFFGDWKGPAVSIEAMNDAMARAAAEANR
jgi:AbrB family looped-hinge helix DNA binding protein